MSSPPRCSYIFCFLSNFVNKRPLRLPSCRGAISTSRGCADLLKINPIENKKVTLLIMGLVSAGFFVLYWLFNTKTGYINDDYTYRLVFEGWRVAADPVKVSSFSDIAVSMKNHYLLWGGRVPVHTAIQLLLWLAGDRVFNVINALMAVLLGWLVWFHAGFGRKRGVLLFGLINALLWFCLPQPELTLLNLTNSVNNMWTCIFVLLFLVPYRFLFAGGSAGRKHGVPAAAAMVPFGFLAGWSSEPAGAAAGAFAVVMSVLLLRSGKKLPAWAYAGILSMAAGWAVMSFAPGYRYKAANYYGVESVLKNIFGSFGAIQKNLWSVSLKNLWPLLVLLALAAVAYRFVLKKKTAALSKKGARRAREAAPPEPLREEACFVFGAFVSVAVYVVSPEFVPRYLFPAAVFLLIASGSLLTRALPHGEIKHRARLAAGAAVLLVCLGAVSADALREYAVVSYNAGLSSALENDIRSQVHSGKADVVVRGDYRFLSTARMTIYRYDFVGMDVIWGSPDSNGEINRLLAANYGAKSYTNLAQMSFVKEKP